MTIIMISQLKFPVSANIKMHGTFQAPKGGGEKSETTKCGHRQPVKLPAFSSFNVTYLENIGLSETVLK